MKKLMTFLWLFFPVILFSADIVSEIEVWGKPQHPNFKTGYQRYERARNKPYGKLDSRYEKPAMPYHLEAFEAARKIGDFSGDDCQFGCGWVAAQQEDYNKFSDDYRRRKKAKKKLKDEAVTEKFLRDVNTMLQVELEAAEHKQKGYQHYRKQQESNEEQRLSMGQEGYQTPQLPVGYYERWEIDNNVDFDPLIPLSDEYYFVEGFIVGQTEFRREQERLLGSEYAQILFQSVEE